MQSLTRGTHVPEPFTLTPTSTWKTTAFRAAIAPNINTIGSLADGKTLKRATFLRNAGLAGGPKRRSIDRSVHRLRVVPAAPLLDGDRVWLAVVFVVAAGELEEEGEDPDADVLGRGAARRCDLAGEPPLVENGSREALPRARGFGAARVVVVVVGTVDVATGPSAVAVDRFSAASTGIATMPATSSTAIGSSRRSTRSARRARRRSFTINPPRQRR